jgi:hypothetical protein
MVRYCYDDSPRCSTLDELAKKISDSILLSNGDGLNIYVEDVLLDKKVNSDIYFQALTILKKFVQNEREKRREAVKKDLE